MSETTNHLPTASNRQKYVSLFVLAILTYAVFIATGHPLVGVAVYFVCGLSGIVYRVSQSRPLFDERDRTLKRAAADRTLNLIGVAAAIGFPAAVVYYAVEGNRWPPWLFWLGVYTAALYLFYGGVRVYTRYER